LPQFDGSTPKLWQLRCEEYFSRWNTPERYKASTASSSFTGAAAQWLESFLTKSPHPSWSEFSQAVQARFCRNQHQILVRRMFHICQTATIYDYVQRFSDLLDKISAFEAHPDPVYYLTRFLDGLKPAVRVLVAIQQPKDLDTAFTLALLYEELGDGYSAGSGLSSVTHTRSRQQAVPPPPPQPPAKWISKSVEEKKAAESSRSMGDDRWNSLKLYRRSKGLCYTCGEKWGREHQCSKTIQLHVVQEMLDCWKSETEEDNSETDDDNLMLLSAVAEGVTKSSSKAMKLRVVIQGKSFLFLIDSGSSACFIDRKVAEKIQGHTSVSDVLRVKVAGGGILTSSAQLPSLLWSARGHEFSDNFRILPLSSYDGILGLDWLAKHSPMLTHWGEQWIALPSQGEYIVLHGEEASGTFPSILELHVLSDDSVGSGQQEQSPGIQQLLDQFAQVFATPTELPPRRQYDH